MRLNPSSVTRFVEAVPPEHPARWAIVASWNRCSHLSPHAPPAFHRVSDADLAARLERSARLVEASSACLERLLRQLSGVAKVAYVTDGDGIVLASKGDAAQLRRYCLLPGYDWSEARMGTNGAGTCLATGRPMVVAGNEHYMSAFHDFTCIAAPIRDRDTRIAGTLDVGSRTADPREHRGARIMEAALEIERLLREG